MTDPVPSKLGYSAEQQTAEERVSDIKGSIVAYQVLIVSLEKTLVAALETLAEIKRRIALDEKSRLK